MIIDETFALHITWTTYGSRLPGDERGYVSNTFVSGAGYLPKENVPGTPITAGDATTRDRARSLQKWPTVYLDATEDRSIGNRTGVSRRRQAARLAHTSRGNHDGSCPCGHHGLSRQWPGGSPHPQGRFAGEAQ